jgi:hypothetical protein
MRESRTFLDVDDWRAHLARAGEHLHVYLDGVDVTRGAFQADFFEDGVHGQVWRYKRNAQGHHYLDPERPREAAYEVLFGVLVIAPGDPWR